MTVERLECGGWPNCYRVSNGLVDLIVTTDVGPRVIRFGFVGNGNEFKEYDDQLGATGGDSWRIYGGHRLWHAPEARPRTYCPDNSPVALEHGRDIVRLLQPTEDTTGIQKEIDIRLSPTQPKVELTHRLRAHRPWEEDLAPWALSVMAPGGKAIIPLPPRASHEERLSPAGSVTLWSYTDMRDPRWTWGGKYLTLAQDPSAFTPQKAGLMVTEGWLAYAREGHLFVKEFDYLDGGRYPDFGCSVEVFTDAEMLELETLGPLVRLRAGEAVEHVERWLLFRDVPMPRDDADVDRYVLPKIQGEDA